MIRRPPHLEKDTFERRFIMRVTKTELDWLRHASKLRRMSVTAYVRRAVNDSLRRQGVDAVLLREFVRAAHDRQRRTHADE